MDVGMGELIVIFLVVLLLFGANKLPALGEGLGKAVRGFRDAVRDKPPAPPRSPAPEARRDLPSGGAGGERGG